MTQESLKTGQTGMFDDSPADPFGDNVEEVSGEQQAGEQQLEQVTLETLQDRYIELHKESRDLKAREKANLAERNAIEPVIAARYAALQIQQQNNMRGETIYLAKEIWASLVRDEDGSTDEAHKALQEHGLGYLVQDKVDSRSLSAWVREQRREKTEIPEGLLPFLKISEAYRVKTRL